MSMSVPDPIIERIAKEVVEREMTAPAVFFLEMGKPFTFLGNQFLIFMNPIIQSIFNSKNYDLFTEFLEDRNNIEKLISKIEELEEKRKGEEKKLKQEKKEKKKNAIER